MSPQIQMVGERRVRSTGRYLVLMTLLLLASCGKHEFARPPDVVVEPRVVERVPVTSSYLQSVGYDDSSRTLTVEFRNGAVYEYEDVSPETHSELMSAESHGKYFYHRIRTAEFRAQRLH